jgi:hypothetical protein
MTQPHQDAQPAVDLFAMLDVDQMQKMLAELDDDAVAQLFLDQLHALNQADAARDTAVIRPKPA